VSVKRTKHFDGLFSGETLTWDFTKPVSDQDFALLQKTFEANSVLGRVARYEAYIADFQNPERAVKVRLDRMQAALAIAKKGETRDAVLMAIENAELWRREIEALPHAVRGAKQKGRLQQQLPDAIAKRKVQAANKRATANLYLHDLQNVADDLRRAHPKKTVGDIRDIIRERYDVTRAEVRKLKIPLRGRHKAP
jgi:hypothetical protein